MSGNQMFFAGCLLAIASDARAQSTGSAEALFRDGRQLMAAGKTREACEAFEGSERLEHNVSTIMNLANCREQEGRLASAWSLFLQVEAQTRTEAQAALNAAAKQHAQGLEAKLSYLTLEVHDHTSGLVVMRDGKPVDAAELNVPIPVDAGPHTISSSAPHRVAWAKTLQIGALDKQTIDLPVLVVQVDPPVVHRVAAMFSARREVSLGVAAGALLLAGGSILLGASSSGLDSDARARCSPTICSTDDATAAQGLEDRAHSRAIFADVGFALAGTAALTAVALWIWGAPATSSRIEISPTPTGFAVGGRF